MPPDHGELGSSESSSLVEAPGLSPTGVIVDPFGAQWPQVPGAASWRRSTTADWGPRLSSAADRGLPDFLIVGAMKAGTTSLFSYLSQHPHVMPAVVKQVRFFDGGWWPGPENYQAGTQWYRSFFPLRSELAASGAITGEASPATMWHPLAAQRIAKVVPDIKLIAILRDPIDRAVSHYHQSVRTGAECLDLATAISAEPERLHLAYRQADWHHPSWTFHSYRSRGHYREQLDRLRHVGLSLLVVHLERLAADPHPVLAQVFEYLGIDPAQKIPAVEPVGVGSYTRGKDQEARSSLADYFNGPNRDDVLFNPVTG